jgi:hypothetical protein
MHVPPPRCGAKTRSREGTCKKVAGAGTDHYGIGRCKWHGGSTPTHRKQAALQQLRDELAAIGAKRQITPAQALLERVQAKAAEVEYWTRVVQAEQDAAVQACEDNAALASAGALLWGRATEVADTKIDNAGNEHPTVTTSYKAGPSASLAMLHEAERDLAQFCALAMRAGVDEAIVRLAAVQGAAVIDLVRRAVQLARTTQDGADQILAGLVRGETVREVTPG